jgi:hypothetical protein
MAAASILVFIIYGVGITFGLIALIYLIAKRIDAKKREDFEKRDN